MSDRKDCTSGEEGIDQQENRMADHSADQPDRKVPADRNDFEDEDDPEDTEMVAPANHSLEPNPDHHDPSDHDDDKEEDYSVDTESVQSADYSSEDRQDSSEFQSDDLPITPPSLFPGRPNYNSNGEIFKVPISQPVSSWAKQASYFDSGLEFKNFNKKPIELPHFQLSGSVDLHSSSYSTGDPMVPAAYAVGAVVVGGVLFVLCAILWHAVWSCDERKSNYRASIARARAPNRPRNEVSRVTPRTRSPVAASEDYVAVNITPDRTEFISSPCLPSLAAKDDLPPSYITCLLEEDHPPSYSTWMLGDIGDSCGLPDSPGIHGTSKASWRSE